MSSIRSGVLLVLYALASLQVGCGGCGGSDTSTAPEEGLAPESCQDGLRNGSETGVDCGGKGCPACGVAQPCQLASDCTSEVCSAGLCQAPICADSVRNGTETDVDCGGGSCPACSTAQGCTGASDCQSGVCTAGVCQSATCSDGVKNGDETAVDCGGGTCAACDVGGGCTSGADCQSGVCTANVCQAASCSDAVHNGDETGTDCGGSCPACTTGGGCNSGADCQSGVCVSSVCVPATCTDSVRNGTETDVDCGGGSCPACTTGGGCTSGGDCASGICTGNVCQPATCSDGVQNGDETDVDCGGGTCQDCQPGEGCGTPGDCGTNLCVDGTCSQCTDSTQCAAGHECRQGGCVPDTFAPTVLGAFLPDDRVLRVRFSEAMDPATTGGGAAHLANYCVERTDDTPLGCTPTADFALVRAVAADASNFDLELSSAPRGGSYTVLVTGAVDRAGNALGSPRYADFDGTASFRIVSATSAGATTVRVAFSRAVRATPDAAGSAGCSSPQTCARRYALMGASALGGVLYAEVLPVPHENEVLLTHAAAQVGGNYTVIGADGRSGDGFDNAASEAIARLVGTETLGAMPLDRATFTGLGRPIEGFGDGPLAVAPFGDGTPFAYVFKYQDRVYLGPNSTGSRAVRMKPDGSQVQDLGYSFTSDVNWTGTHSLNSASAPFPGVGHVGCANNSYACGPDNEDGRGLFTSGVMGGEEWLVLGGSQSGGGLDYIYMTRDADTTLNMKYVDLSEAVDGTTKTFSAMGIYGGRAYLGFPATSGSRKPLLLSLLRTPSASFPGLDAHANGRGINQEGCDPGVHDLCNLAANKMPGIGTGGTPANTAATVLVDFVSELEGLVYLGNNGGLMRSRVSQPRDYENYPGDWAVATPAAPEYAAYASQTTLKGTDLEPSDKAWTPMAAFNGRVYLGRNTVAGPQLWRCDPGEDRACDPADWRLIAANGSGDPLLSQFDNAHNARLTLLVVNGGSLYVGYDNAVDGVVVYRSNAQAPATRADFSGGDGCPATSASCQGIGGNGFGLPELNKKFNDAVSLSFDGKSYLYVSVSDGLQPGTPARLYRHLD